ncbi:MAG: hypothetical protein ACK55I_09885, partial [bacterium]
SVYILNYIIRVCIKIEIQITDHSGIESSVINFVFYPKSGGNELTVTGFPGGIKIRCGFRCTNYIRVSGRNELWIC